MAFTRLSRPACSKSTLQPCRRELAVVKPARFVCAVAKTADTVTTSTNGAHALGDKPTNMLEFEELSDIIRMVHDTDIVEFELKSKRFSLSVKKKEAMAEPVVQVVHAAPAAAPAMAAPAPAAAAPAPAPAAAAPRPAAAPAAAKPAKVEGVEVTSPMSGTFYGAAAPGEPAFVKVGDRVVKGQTVCIIEAMKLMNEIEAEVAGEVVAILATNGSAISPGEPIMVIKP